MKNEQIQVPAVASALGTTVPLQPFKQTRTRRSSDVVRQERVNRELDLAKKAHKRAELLAARQKRALERAAEAQTRAEELAAAPVPTKAGEAEHNVPPAERNSPEMKKKVAAVRKDFATFMKEMKEKHGIRLEFSDHADMTVVKRGFISIRMRGFFDNGITNVTGRKIGKAGDHDIGVIREQARFLQYHKLIGLPMMVLNKELTFPNDNNTYVVTGLRGKSHLVVLRNKVTREPFTVTADDLKAAMKKG
jgi:hypothetical protein